MVEAGTAAILRFLRQLKQGIAEASHRVKVSLLGKAESGKTSLLQRMKGERGGDPGRTTLLEIHDHHFEPKLSSHPELRLHMYDFGGQEVYSSTHRLFLTPDSIVVLVVNLHDVEMEYRKGKAEAAEVYCRKYVADWIRSVCSQHPSERAPVFAVVGTHADMLN